MADQTETQDVQRIEEEPSAGEDREASCCYVVDACGCYVDPCFPLSACIDDASNDDHPFVRNR